MVRENRSGVKLEDPNEAGNVELLEARAALLRLDEEEVANKRILLGKNCPPEQVALFDCLRDGELRWNADDSRISVSRGSFSMGFNRLKDNGDMQEFSYSEAFEIVYHAEPNNLDLEHCKKKIQLLAWALDERLRKRRTPFHVFCWADRITMSVITRKPPMQWVKSMPEGIR